MRGAQAGHSSARPGRARYQLRAELARGGMGIIHRAYDSVLGREVAYKQLLLKNEALRLRQTALFQSEYNTLAQLVHPRIVDVYEYGLDALGPYYTMELLSGHDLAEAAPLSVQAACSVARDVASALGLLHARRLVHRDVTPVNVRIAVDGRAKLLDFGALAQFGQQTHVVGTPAFIAPECLSDSALDQRADLYGLGAVLYFALTGHGHLRASSLEELVRAWREDIVPPSQLTAGVPQALDELVLSLLQHDRLARPQTVAHVIDRLNAIADLPIDDTEHLSIAQSYLAHPPLVGRGVALAELELTLLGALDGSGGALLIEALHGMGRTALLEHMELRAQLLGATALRVSGGAHPGALGVVRALVRGALRCDPQAELALRARYPQATAFCLQEGSGRRVEGPHEVVIPAQTAERQATLAAEILRCLVELSRLNPLVLLLDDAQRADTESLGVLASLAEDASVHAVAIAATVAIDESSSDATLLGMYKERARCLVLAPLSQEDTSELVSTLFGGVPNCLRLALWLHTQTQGHPLHTMALATMLLARGVVRYGSGRFSLPHDVSADFGEVDLGRALLARCEGLGGSAAKVLRLLSIYEQVPSVDELVASVELPHAEVRLALEALSNRGILSVSEERISFVHRALRTTIESSLGSELRRALHRRAAQAILAQGSVSRELSVQAGLHLLRADEAREGAELLAEAAIELAYTAEGSSKITGSLEEALGVFEREGRSDKACIRILTTLTVAGFYGDPRLTTRYFQRTFDALLELSGVRVAAALGAVFGRRLALAVGIVYAWVAYLLTPKKERMPTFGELLTGLFGVAVAGAGALAAAYEPEATVAVSDRLEPFATLGKRSPASAAREMCLGMAENLSGHHGQSTTRLARLAERLVKGGVVRGLNDEVRQQMQLGCIYLVGISEVFTGERGGLTAAEQLESAPREFTKPRAELLRMCHFGFRGEQDRADAHRLAAERLSLLGGNSWSALTAMAVRSLMVAQWTGDSVALARVIEELERVVPLAPGLHEYRDIAEAYLEFSRGKAERALELHQRLARTPHRFPMVIGGLQQAHHAAVLRSLGQNEQARRLCLDGLAQIEPENRRFCMMHQLLHHELALAEARLGDTRRAAARLEQLLAEQASLDNPLLRGSVHRDRARVALLARDRPSFDRHLAAMNRFFRATQNPCLIQQCDALAAQAVSTGVHPIPAAFVEARTRSGAVADESRSDVDTVIEPNPFSPRS